MATLKKHDLSGKEVGSVTVEDSFLDVEVNGQMIKDYIVALRRNARQWSANTKGRAEVKHTTKKPYKQKGTGSARHGNLVTAQYRGGGIVFGPKPKFDQHVRINKKERNLAVHSLLAEKIKDGSITVVEDKAFGKALESPKTKVVASFVQHLGLAGRRVLFVGEGRYAQVETEGVVQKVSIASDEHSSFKLSLRNIPRAAYIQAANLNGYDLASAWHIILTESALTELQEKLKP